MKSTQFILVCLIAPVFGLGQIKQKPEAIKDTAAFLEELGKAMREAVIEDYQPSKSKVTDIKADYPVPTSISESQLKEINAAFAGSFSFRPSPFNNNELLMENDNFFYPEPKLVEVDITWLKALDKSNKNWLIPQEKSNEVIDFSVHFSGSQMIKLSSEVAKDIVRVESELTVKAPLMFEKISLTRNDLLQARSLDTLKVKLLRMENDLVGLWVSGDYKNIETYPFNQQGMQLKTHANSSMTLVGDPKESAGLKLPKDLGPGSFIYFKANGKVDRVEILTVSKFMEQKIKMTLTPLTPPESGKLKTTKERYQAFHPVDFTRLTKPDTTAFIGKDKFSIIKDYNEWDKETKWRIAYGLPSHQIQTAYALPEFETLNVFLKNKQIKTFEHEGYFDRETGILSYVPLDDEYKPLDYDEVRGQVLLRYPASIKTFSIKKGEKKYGIEKMEANKLTLNEEALGTASRLIHEDEIQILRAYGKGIWPLKKDNYTMSESVNEVQVYHYFYLGNILSVQLDLPGEWLEMTIPFSIKKTAEKPVVKKKGK